LTQVSIISFNTIVLNLCVSTPYKCHRILYKIRNECQSLTGLITYFIRIPTDEDANMIKSST